MYFDAIEGGGQRKWERKLKGREEAVCCAHRD